MGDVVVKWRYVSMCACGADSDSQEIPRDIKEKRQALFNSSKSNIVGNDRSRLELSSKKVKRRGSAMLPFRSVSAEPFQGSSPLASFFKTTIGGQRHEALAPERGSTKGLRPKSTGASLPTSSNASGRTEGRFSESPARQASWTGQAAEDEDEQGDREREVSLSAPSPPTTFPVLTPALAQDAVGQPASHPVAAEDEGGVDGHGHAGDETDASSAAGGEERADEEELEPAAWVLLPTCQACPREYQLLRQAGLDDADLIIKDMRCSNCKEALLQISNEFVSFQRSSRMRQQVEFMQRYTPPKYCPPHEVDPRQLWSSLRDVFHDRDTAKGVTSGAFRHDKDGGNARLEDAGMHGQGQQAEVDGQGQDGFNRVPSVSFALQSDGAGDGKEGAQEFMRVSSSSFSRRASSRGNSSGAGGLERDHLCVVSVGGGINRVDPAAFRRLNSFAGSSADFRRLHSTDAQKVLADTLGAVAAMRPTAEKGALALEDQLEAQDSEKAAVRSYRTSLDAMLQGIDKAPPGAPVAVSRGHKPQSRKDKIAGFLHSCYDTLENVDILYRCNFADMEEKRRIREEFERRSAALSFWTNKGMGSAFGSWRAWVQQYGAKARRQKEMKDEHERQRKEQLKKKAEEDAKRHKAQVTDTVYACTRACAAVAAPAHILSPTP